MDTQTKVEAALARLQDSIMGFNYTGDAAHRSAADFYPRFEAALSKALESGEDFDTDWRGCKHELQTIRVHRESGNLTVSVSQDMVGGVELFEAAFYDTIGVEIWSYLEDCFSYVRRNELITELANEYGFDAVGMVEYLTDRTIEDHGDCPSTVGRYDLPCPPGVEYIKAIAEIAQKECTIELDTAFENIQSRIRFLFADEAKPTDFHPSVIH